MDPFELGALPRTGVEQASVHSQVLFGRKPAAVETTFRAQHHVSVARAWDEAAANFHTPQNFVLERACCPAVTTAAAGAFHFPSAVELVDHLRQDPGSRISTGAPRSALDLGTDADTRAFADAFRAAPLQQVLSQRFAIAHFGLEVFDVPGGLLEGLRERVVEPWAAALQQAGFTFHRCYPILFISSARGGKRAETSYHMDQSHVVAWQIHGRKRWSWLRDPSRWADRKIRLTHVAGQLHRPDCACLRDEDVVTMEMAPGQALFNKLLTPHWVEAVDGEVAVSLNLSHGGLSLDGTLTANEAELLQYIQNLHGERDGGEGAPSPPVGHKPAWKGLPGQLHRANI